MDPVDRLTGLLDAKDAEIARLTALVAELTQRAEEAEAQENDMRACAAEWSGQASKLLAERDATFNTMLARTEAAERERDAARAALRMMVDHEVDYMTINNLGDPEKQHRIIVARRALEGVGSFLRQSEGEP